MNPNLVITKIDNSAEDINSYLIDGRIDAETSYYFDNQLKELSDSQKIILDFSKVNYMNSFGIGILVDLQKRMMKAGGVIKICGLSPSLKKIFQITYLTKVFEIYDDLDKTIASF